MTNHLAPTVHGVAVIPPAHVDHEDPCIGLHLHIDRRFHRVPDGAVVMIPPGTEPTMEWMQQIYLNPDPFRHREVHALEIYHQSCRVGRDGRCPHQGLPIAAGRLLADGSRLCPGHGLRWAADGSLIAGDAAEAALWSCGISGELDVRAKR
jgi:hypothetical protein